MKEVEVAQLTESLISKHDLDDWSFRLGNTRRAIGRCIHRKKFIEISRHYIPLLSDDEVKDVILHEIAHAIAGYKAGHGPKWKEVAKMIGADPTRCANIPPERTPQGRYKLECVNHGLLGYNHRLRQNIKDSYSRGSACYLCKKCKTPVIITDLVTGKKYESKRSL